MNFYETLEVSPKASQEVIRAAYKSLMQCYHPDKNPGDVGIEQRVLLIGHAYDVLSDPVKRAIYDVELNQLSKELSATRSTSINIKPTPLIKDVKLTWLNLGIGIALMLIIVYGAISSASNYSNQQAAIAINKDEAQKYQAEQEAAIARKVAINEEEAQKKIADDKVELARRTISEFALNLSTPLSYSYSGQALSIPKLGIVVGKKDSENVVQYIKNNKALILKNLAINLSYIKVDELIKIDGEQYLNRFILFNINNSVGTEKHNAYGTTVLPEENDRGVVAVLLTESFVVH